MKKFPLIITFFTIVCISFLSCIENEGEEYWKKYQDWREANQLWLEEQALIKNADGSNYYEVLNPVWDKKSYVLIHYFNDRNLTKNNLSPLFTSTVDVKYIGYLYDGTPFDSSYLNIEPADSIFRTKLSGVINGWTIALTDMHVGDSCEVLIPYQYAYGETGGYNLIKPYSALKFRIKLVDIPGYEINVTQ